MERTPERFARTFARGKDGRMFGGYARGQLLPRDRKDCCD
jgi:hypothetical protein